MKRDMDLIRLILFDVEGEREPDHSGYTPQQITYHAALLIDAGLVRGSVIRDEKDDPAGAVMVELTWEGHEFLDKARSDTTWNKAKALARGKGVSLSVDLNREERTQ
jgi:hypothetical protein